MSGNFGEKRKLKMAMIGIGVGGAEILPAMEGSPNIELVAGADVNATTRERFKERYPNTRVYDSAEALCQDKDIEAVWISTPNRFHAPHAILAAQHGKHVVVEKPMALSLEEAEQMVAEAKRNKVHLMAGHTMAYTLPIRAMRKIISSGAIGKLRALHVWTYSDWMLRPRAPEELDETQGGGVPMRQTPHQIDTVRLIGGGMLRSVRGTSGNWHPERPAPGYYSAYMEFEDGTPVTIMHNGYGYFATEELVPWTKGYIFYDVNERARIRKAMRDGTRPEVEEKQALRIGGKKESWFREQMGPQAWMPLDLGIVIASCERGDIRHSQYGLFVYDDEGVRDVDLKAQSGILQRRAELDEFYNAVVLGKPLFHSGEWGMATLEAGQAIVRSGKERREIMLSRQVAVPADYDAELKIPYPQKREGK